MNTILYNSEQKKRYLEYRGKKSDDVPPLIKSIFHKTFGLESVYKKDVCDFNREQVEDLMFYLGLGTYSSIAFVYYTLIDYVDWCFGNGLIKDGMNHFRDIEYKDISKFINKRISDSKIISREDLLNHMWKLENPRDQIFLLSCFEFGVGKEYRDFLNMEMGDVDEENNILHLTTRNVKVSGEWIAIAKEASTTYEVYTNIHDFQHPLVRKLQLEHSNKIFKNTIRVKETSATDDKMFIQKRMARIFVSIKKTLGLPGTMKAQSIINSGRIYYINTNAKERGISAEDFIKGNRKEIENQFGMLCNPVLFIREYHSYLE